MSIQSFSSFEEMQAYMAQKAREAQERVLEHQQPLADGKKHYFLRLVAFGAEVLLIVGEIFDVEEHAARSWAKYGPQGTGEYEDGEFEYEIAQMRARLADGFVFTRSFSVIEPEGELGDAHIATMLEIPAEVFEAVKEVGFDLKTIVEDEEHIARPYISRWTREVAFQ